jgi:hypothetical protein
MTNFPIMPLSPPKSPPRLVFQGFSFLDGTENTTPLTYSSAPLGTAAANRYIVVVGHTFTNTAALRGISTVTLDGVTMTELVKVVSGGGVAAPTCTGIFMLKKTSGTTGTVVVNVDGAINSKGAAVYSLYDSNEWFFPNGTASSFTTTVNPITSNVSLAIAGDGAALAATTNINRTDPTWTSNLTKNYGVDIRTNEWASGASLRRYAGSPSATINPNVEYQSLVAVSFA